MTGNIVQLHSETTQDIPPERVRMARYLDLPPHTPSEWPVSLLDRLLIEREGWDFASRTPAASVRVH